MFGFSDRQSNESDLDYNKRKKRENKIYNEAIEQAAGIAERSETNITQLIAEDIRGLKK